MLLTKTHGYAISFSSTTHKKIGVAYVLHCSSQELIADISLSENVDAVLAIKVSLFYVRDVYLLFFWTCI